jgi:arsenite methyltransferase
MNQVKHFRYDETVSRRQFDFAMTPDSILQRQIILAALNLQSGDHVLDIGSGNGFLIREIAGILGSTGRATGVDLSDAMTLMARNLCDGLANTKFETANATKLPFDENAFDVVTATQCLSYINQIEVTLAEIYRVVKPGGRVVLIDTDWDTLVWNCTNQSLMNSIMRSYKSIYADAHLPRSFTNKLLDVGFKIVDRRSHTIVNWTHDLNTYAGLQIGFVSAIAQNDCSISEEDLQEWLRDLQEIENRGECFFSLNRYIFCAEKPIS